MVVLLDKLFACMAATAIKPLESHKDDRELWPWVEKYNLLQIHGIWYKEGHCVLMGTQEEKQSIIATHHDPPAYGHPGCAQTTKLIAQQYWWPTLKRDAIPFKVVTMDFIVKLPVLQGYNSILTTDHDCSNLVVLIPCQEGITAEGVAGLYVKHVFAHYGLPSKIISDHDPCFASKFMHTL